ncbi:exported hypothetical protein [Candidatus Terasakiella magnetica]|uniref:Flagellar assembly protein T N-terminal domain-containing protein n=1 Tax=Candidatus Terasakiella magnetica TaxID=1867952 RepID=A0A1C3RHR9_9PROT|nr:hypothetical protein [Candidatus Terasakiella magnetica]SCA56821.1 exported hypothetical protein [Candidatus Terasakiella magnetica]
MKRSLILLSALLITSFMSLSSAHALQVSAQGSNQRQALNNALRQAVEMTLGTEIENNTLVENFQVVRQQILSHTKGFVRSYKILDKKVDPSGMVEVTIEAEVDEQSLKDSSIALSTLMKMAAHPRVLVAPIDEDFDSLSSLSDDFHLLSEAVESTLREDFRFETLDFEATRLKAKDKYRYTDRKNNLKRARRNKVDFIIFVEVIKARNHPYKLRLESVEVATNRSLAKEEVGFAMSDWTRDEKSNHAAIINQAKDHIYGPSAQVAAALIENIRKEVYEEGQRYRLSFQRFDEKTIKFLETDLSALSGYVRHKLDVQKKKALSLSYWSLLKPGTLNQEISALLKAQDISFDFRLEGRTLKYRYDDPMFE